MPRKRRPQRRSDKTPPPLWPIDYPDPDPRPEAVTLADGRAVEVRLSFIHWAYLAWLQKRHSFDVMALLNRAAGDTPRNINKAVSAAVLRLYAHREATHQPRPPWLSPLI